MAGPFCYRVSYKALLKQTLKKCAKKRQTERNNVGVEIARRVPRALARLAPPGCA